jgi:hypothetical protein
MLLFNLLSSWIVHTVDSIWGVVFRQVLHNTYKQLLVAENF